MGSLPPAALAAAALAGGLLALGVALRLALLPRPLPAVLAVVAGAGLLALPWVGGRYGPAAPAAPAPATVGAITISADRARTIVGSRVGQPPPVPGREAARIDIEASEAEPNDTIAGANAARLGSAIEGRLAEGDVDAFAFEAPPHLKGTIVAALVTLDGSAALTLVDDAGRPLGTARTLPEIRVRTATVERSLDAPRYYVLVLGLAGTATYHLTVTAARWR